MRLSAESAPAMQNFLRHPRELSLLRASHRLATLGLSLLSPPHRILVLKLILPPMPPQTIGCRADLSTSKTSGSRSLSDLLHLKHKVQTTASTTLFTELQEFQGLLPGCYNIHDYLTDLRLAASPCQLAPCALHEKVVSHFPRSNV